MKELEARALCLKLALKHPQVSLSKDLNMYMDILTDNGRFKFEDRLELLGNNQCKSPDKEVVEYPSSINVTSRTCG